MGRKRAAEHGASAAAGTPAVAALVAAGVPHTVHTFEVEVQGAPGDFGLRVAAALGVDPRRLFKTLMVAAPDGSLAACVVPVVGHLDLKAAAAALGVKKVEMADLAVVERRTGYVRGGVSPLGQRRRHPVVLDVSALDADVMYVSGGQRGVDIELAPADLVRASDAVVAPIAAGRLAGRSG